jgi:hypothetical protein
MQVQLTQGKVAHVDDADRHTVQNHAWKGTREQKRGVWYAYAVIGGRTVYMHRFLTGAMPGQEVDHVNGDGLDNRRANLRVCSRQANSWNGKKRCRSSSRYKGVTRRPSGRWHARINVDAKQIHLGSFACEDMAAEAYDGAARKLYGEFAAVNFPMPGETSALV